MKNKGMVYVFTGDGKGKTSAAIGVVVRALINNWKVCWVSFYKGKDWDISEKELGRKFKNLEMHWVGEGFLISKSGGIISKSGVRVANIKGGKVIDKVSRGEHINAAKEGLRLVESKIDTGDYKLIVIDEVLNAVSDKLLSEDELFRIIERRGGANIVLTGRGGSEKIIKLADLVTECRKVKHPYDEGVLAVKGLDY